MSDFEPLFTWVHLSDIHMGHGDAEHGWNQQIVLTALQKNITDADSRGLPSIDALLATGDLAFSGSVRRSDEYQRVASWLRELAESLSVDADSIFVIPGNHDVQRNIEVEDENVADLLRSLRSDEKRIDNALSDGTERALLTKRMQNYLDFARNFAPANADAASEDSNLFWTQRIEVSERLTIRLSGFNTALLCTKEEDEYGDWGKLQLGQEQIARAFSQTPIVRDQEVVVALSHHPFDWLRDKIRVSSAVRQHAHIHLCGHVHEAESARLRSGDGTDLVRVVAGAAHGESAPADGTDRHGYSIGSIGVRGDGRVVLRIWPRIWSRNYDFRVDHDSIPEVDEDYRPYRETYVDHVLHLKLTQDSDLPTVDKMDHASQAHSPVSLANTKGNVPYARNPFFTGRSKILDALEEISAVTSTHAISGLGGIGKTQTAVEYAYRHRDKYEAVFWAVGENEATVVSSYADIAGVLDLPEASSSDSHRIVESLKRWFETHAHWLLIVDSVDSPSRIKGLLPPMPGGHILITSRAQNFDMLGIPRAFDLQTMPPNEALEFLLKRAGRQDTDAQEKQAADKLVKELGCLPLAIEQAGAYIVAHRARFDHYLASFENRRLELLETSPPVAGDYPSSVATTWSLNFEEIEQVSLASADLLRLSAFLGPDSSIPLELITQGASETGPELSAALAQVQEDPVAIHTLLEPLTRYSLVRRDIESNSYNLHPLVQEVIKAAMDEETRRLWTDRVEKVLLKVSKVRWKENLPLQLLPLISHLQAVADAAKYREDEQTADLCNALSLCLFQLERFEEALPYSQRAWELTEKSLGAEDPETLAKRENYGVMLKNVGDFDTALWAYRELLKTSKRVLGYQHRNIASIHNNIGAALREKGVSVEDESLIAKTLPHYKRALKIRQMKLGEHTSTAESLYNMGALLMDLNRYDEARPCLEQAVKMNEKIKGPLYGRNADFLKSLGTVQRKQADRKGARASYEQELKVRKKAFGVEHPETARTLHDLVDILIEQGLHEAASQYLERELTTSEAKLGEHHPYTNLVRQRLNDLSS